MHIILISAYLLQIIATPLIYNNKKHETAYVPYFVISTLCLCSSVVGKITDPLEFINLKNTNYFQVPNHTE